MKFNHILGTKEHILKKEIIKINKENKCYKNEKEMYKICLEMKQEKGD